MGKSSAPARTDAKESMAVVRNLRVSPRKLGLVVDSIRGHVAAQAVRVLAFSKRRIAVDVRKAVMSAIANAENNHNLDVDRLVVHQAYVGKGLVMRRFRPRARGRVGKIEKPFSRLTLIMREVEDITTIKPNRKKRRPDSRTKPSENAQANVSKEGIS